MILSLLFSSLLMALGAVLVYGYYYRKGQFDDPEEAKYLVFRDED